MKAVVHAWSERLNAGDNAGVARLFALPSVIAQGSLVYRFRTREQLKLVAFGPALLGADRVDRDSRPRRGRRLPPG